MSRIKNAMKKSDKKNPKDCIKKSDDKYQFLLIDSNSAYVEKNIGE